MTVFPCHRIAQLGRDLRERLQHETPLAEPRMRHDQSRLVNDLLAKQDQIQIERPRRVRIRALPPPLALDREQGVQQRPRRQRVSPTATAFRYSGCGPTTPAGTVSQ